MAKQTEPKLRIIGEGGVVLFDRKITSLPLKEETIIAKSVEFFSDPEPCMIHRSAVMKRLYTEISEHFERLRTEEVSLESIPGEFRSWLDL